MAPSLYTLDQLVEGRHSLANVEVFKRQGWISEDVYKAYCHVWQISAFRYSVQACRCAECLKTGPESDRETGEPVFGLQKIDDSADPDNDVCVTCGVIYTIVSGHTCSTSVDNNGEAP